jgi:hypothetical protein
MKWFECKNLPSVEKGQKLKKSDVSNQMENCYQMRLRCVYKVLGTLRVHVHRMEHVKPTINTNPRKLMVRVGQLPGEAKVRSDQWHVKIDGFVSSQLGDTWVPLHYKFIF